MVSAVVARRGKNSVANRSRAGTLPRSGPRGRWSDVVRRPEDDRLAVAGVDGALEVLEEIEHGGVGEGQDLGQDHASDAPSRIDPVVRIREPGPGQAAGAPT